MTLHQRPQIGIECAKCGHIHPSDRIYDNTPCARCGNLLTAYMTDQNGRRMSQDEYLRLK